MVKKTFRVTADIKRPVHNREFEVVDGDTGSELLVSVVDGGAPVDLTGCRTAAVFQHSRGIRRVEGGISAGTADGRLVIELPPECAAPGLVECELRIYSGGGYVTSARFGFGCRAGAGTAGE